MSAIIRSATHIRKDILYFAYPGEEGCRYGWAFPLSGDMWNVGIWEPENPKRLQISFASFKVQYLDHYFRDVVIGRPLRGAPLGTIRPVASIGTHGLFFAETLQVFATLIAEKGLAMLCKYRLMWQNLL